MSACRGLSVCRDFKFFTGVLSAVGAFGADFGSVFVDKEWFFMNMNSILEGFIARFFRKRLMPGILDGYRRLQGKYGAAGDCVNEGGAGDGNPQAGVDFFVGSFGFQTAFMMKYMCMAFGAVCVALLVISLGVNSEAFQGLQIFLTFFGLCLVLWALSKLQSGFVVYTRDWLFVNRPFRKADFDLKLLSEVLVEKQLTLVFSENGSSGGAKVVVPLEGNVYLDFMVFLEREFPEVYSRIPKDKLAKGRKKHGAAWGNRI